MFFLIDKEKRAETLSRAIDALDKDGVVLIWDILKTPALKTTSYYNKMMNNDEIEEICKPHNIVARLHQKDFEELDQAQSFHKPIVYLVQKKKG